MLTIGIFYDTMNIITAKGCVYMASTSMNIRMDIETKRKAEALFGEIGMNMTTAINIFLKQAIRENGIPFELKINQPNAETLAAINDGEEIIKKGTARFNTADEMFADLGIQSMLKPEYTAKFKKRPENGRKKKF